jgi:hypothetical protein
MTETFTHNQHITFSTSEEKFSTKKEYPDFAGPSEKSIQAILNFSKNLEVHHSNFVTHIVTIKS